MDYNNISSVSHNILYDTIKEVGKGVKYVHMQYGISDIWNVVDDQTHMNIGNSIARQIKEKMWT